jgi:hypothetical protein
MATTSEGIRRSIVSLEGVGSLGGGALSALRQSIDYYYDYCCSYAVMPLGSAEPSTTKCMYKRRQFTCSMSTRLRRHRITASIC